MAATVSPQTTDEGRKLPAWRAHLAWLVIALPVFAVCLYVRIRLLNVPLERDEGEFAYIAQLMLHGIPPYLSAYTMKLPGAPVLYALFMSIFGETTAGIRIGLLLVDSASVFMVFLLGRRLCSRFAGGVAAAAFALLTLSSGTMGLFAHATYFVVCFVLAAFLLLFRSIEKGSRTALFLSGLCFGFAILVKQHAALFPLFALLYLVWQERKPLPRPWRSMLGSVLLFATAVLFPFALCSLILYRLGTFDRYWFWVFSYASQYVSSTSLAEGAAKFVEQFAKVVSGTFAIWLAAAVGLALLIGGRSAKARPFLLGLLCFSFLTACPGLFFRQHYFVPMLPAVALLTGVLADWIRERLSLKMPQPGATIAAVAIFLILFSLPLFLERKTYFELEPNAVSDAVNGANPFVESIQVAQYLREHTTPDDTIAVLGSEPQIFFYSGRRSATGHIYMYGLMEDQKYAPRMQGELVSEIEAARPKYLINTLVETSWLRTDRSCPLIFDWSRRYIEQHYRLVGIADIFAEMTVYRWDNEVTGYVPRSNAIVTVYRRID
jgi:hypothetical protein